MDKDKDKNNGKGNGNGNGKGKEIGKSKEIDLDFRKIWEQGFRDQKTTIQQHELNQMMERKSEDIVEKIRRTVKKDQKAYPFVVALLVIPLLLFGYYEFAIFLAGAFAALHIVNKQMIAKLDEIEIKDKTLPYLLAVRALFRDMKVFYSRLLGIGMPLITIPVFLFSLELAGIPMEEFFSPQQRWQGIGVMLVVAGLFSLIGIFSYRASTAYLYGKDLERIDETIEELSENRAS